MHCLQKHVRCNSNLVVLGGCLWKAVGSPSGGKDGSRIAISFPHVVTQVAWHRKGDYFATVSPRGGSSSVLLHQLSKGVSQNPFKKVDRTIVNVSFHPSRPLLFLCSQKAIRLYDLSRQLILKKIPVHVKQLTSMAVHPSGDHLVVGSLDQQVSWFDLELSSEAYQTLRYTHKFVHMETRRYMHIA